jgi:hypothetical protein
VIRCANAAGLSAAFVFAVRLSGDEADALRDPDPSFLNQTECASKVDFPSSSLRNFRQLQASIMRNSCLYRRPVHDFDKFFFLVEAGELEAGL